MDNFTNICEATSQSHDLDNYKPTHRKGKKLLAEKKRRARINNCLLQIRNIVCEGADDKDTDLEKMEKAEILEKTLEVLTRLRHDYRSPSSSSSYSTRKAMAVRYASGFSSCAEESIRYIQNSHLVPTEVKVQLQTHLRAIARRMEAGLQDESTEVNYTQSYPTSPSLSSPSSSMMSGRLTTVVESREEMYKTDISRSQISEIGTYTPSPIHFSTPISQPYVPVSSTVTRPNQEEFVSPTPQTFMKSDCGQKESKQAQYISREFFSQIPQTFMKSDFGQKESKQAQYISREFISPTPQTFMKSDFGPKESKQAEYISREFISQTPQTFRKSDFGQKESKQAPYISSNIVNFKSHDICLNEEVHSSYTVPTYGHPEVSSTGSETDNHYSTNLLSPNSSYSFSNPSMNETELSGNAPIILYPAPVLQSTSLLSDQPVFSYVYESYPSCSMPSILVQPVTYMSTPVRQTTDAHKQPSTPNNALDLCVKRSQVHQISPETMWRPW
ncbi:unnamed protein product [Candidula unifasciata]|uniref:BHLH domain-containing protein n=1 Tax=Candidula unifasciata TaxID=100452 RepID=A0A8S3ZA87_9EUPU|nr:unnamed protein product [Candidula unifasciata]